AGIGVTVGSVHASTGLAEGYDEGDGRFANAGAVTITNTGTRAAEVRLALDPSSATSNLPAAITVSIGAVAAEAECTPSATLADAQSGTLGTGSAATPFEYRSSAVPAELGPE